MNNNLLIPNLQNNRRESNYHLKTKLIEKYLSDDEPTNLGPQKITKNQLEEILTPSYMSPYKYTSSFYAENGKKPPAEPNKEYFEMEKEYKKSKTVRKVTSDYHSNTKDLLEQDENEEKLQKQNKDELTIDRIVYDINKQHISFNRRRTEVQINHRKSLIKRRPNILNQKDIDSVRQLSGSKKVPPEDKPLLRVRVVKEKGPRYHWRRVKICLTVIETIQFLQREMKLFGIKPSPSDYNFLQMRDYGDDQLDLTKHSYCNRNAEWFKTGGKPYLPNYVILPNHFFHKLWRRIIFTNLFIFVIIYPFRIGFYNDDYMITSTVFFVLDIIMELFFLFEIILNCFFAYYNDDGNLEFSFQKILLNYLNEWLIFDIVCLVPYDWILYGRYDKTNKSNIFEVSKLVKFIRIFKFGKVINNLKFVNQIQEFIHLHTGIIKLLYFFINSVILVYTFACLWHYSAIADVTALNWIYKNNFLDDNKWTLFLKSIYFGYTVFITIGYGDIVANTNVEIILVCIWMYISALYYTFTLTSLSNIFLESNAKNLKINNKCLIIEEVFRSSKLKHLIEKTTFYLKRHEDKEFDYSYNLKDLRNLFSEIPTSIKVEIARTMYDNSFDKITIFRELKSRSFIANIIPLLQCLFFNKDTVIYSADEVPEKLYFIATGSVSFTTYDNIVYQSLHEGSYFGEIEILRKTYRESNTITKENCQLLTLTKKIVCNDIVNNYYEFFQLLLKNMVKRWNFFVDMMNLIEKIIDEGKNLFNHELAKIVKHRLKIGFDKSNFNKYYFGIGILNRLEQLKKKSKDNKVDYNIEAINDVFSVKESCDDHLLVKKISRKNKTHVKPLKLELLGVSDDIGKTKDNEEFLLIGADKRKISLKPIDTKSVVNDNQEIINLLKSFHKKLDGYLENQRKQLVYNLTHTERENKSSSKKSKSGKLTERKSLLKKLNSLNFMNKEKSYKDELEDMDMKTSTIFCRKLKTLNFQQDNQEHFKFSDKDL